MPERLIYGIPASTNFSTVFDDRLVTTRIDADLDGRDDNAPFVPLPFFNQHLGHPGQSTSMSIHKGRQYVPVQLQSFTSIERILTPGFHRRLVATWMAESPNSGIAIIPIATDDELGKSLN